jgi:hypothetical protein
VARGILKASRKYNQSVNCLQGNARKSKEIQAKKLAFPCFSLAETGLFNGLQRVQTKKSARA